MTEAINFYTPSNPSSCILTGNNYGKLPQPTMMRSSMESGPDKQRPSSSVLMIQHAVTYNYSNADYIGFLNWYKNTAGFGALWFNWNDPTDSTTKSGRIVGATINQATPQSASMTYWGIQLVIEVYE